MPRQGSPGFSLLELLPVIALLGILTRIASLQLAPLLQRVAVNNGVRQWPPTSNSFGCKPSRITAAYA